MHRFYIPPASWDPDHLALDAEESHHCCHVLRCSEGDKVVAFNGAGVEATATIASVADAKAVKLAPISISKSPSLAVRIALAQAVPKGKNMDLIIQKATELGAAEIFPLLSERTVVSYDAGESGRKAAKWQRVALEACKQSGQNWLPTVHPPVGPERFFAARPDYELLLVASLRPDSQRLKPILAEHAELHNGLAPASALVLVGPEGDFTPSELNLAQSSGCLPLTLGPIVLRSETAAIYTLSILAHELL
ncbi:Lpg2936 family Dot/Icm T4SS effector methyltransferase [soil metagenome]